jgi:hypothetical protein
MRVRRSKLGWLGAIRIVVARVLATTLLATTLLTICVTSSVADAELKGGSTPDAAARSYIDAARSEAVVLSHICHCSVRVSGGLTIARTIVESGHALVSITGKMCYVAKSGTSCVANDNASRGMPSRSLGFMAAYENAVNDFSHSVSPVPCLKVKTLWYIATPNVH